MLSSTTRAWARTMTSDNGEQVQITDIMIPEELSFPEFANAFRIVGEPGGDCILEFIVYVVQTKKAKVVSRVRIRNEFLVNMRDTINRVLPTQHQTPMVHPGGQLVTPDGHGITVFHPGGVGGDDSGEGN